jgi:two-component system alkaline phosphatase synthesis response regulator PhoP
MAEFQARKILQVAQFGDISLDFRRMELSRSGRPVEITLREFKVLKFLISRPGIVVSRRKLINSAWPKRQRSSYRTVDNCIAKLRQKIESNPDCPVLLRTVHGVGYKFTPEEGSHVLWESLSD